MTLGFCHASYMGVSYIMVLRLPNVKGGYKAKKEPTKDYTLYEKNGSIFSLSPDSYTTNGDCTKVESSNQKNINRNPKKNQNPSNNKSNNVKKEKSLTNKFTGFFKSNKKNNKTNNAKKGKSFANKFTGFFKSNKTNKKNSNGNIELQSLNGNSSEPANQEKKEEKEEKQGVFSKCSIL